MHPCIFTKNDVRQKNYPPKGRLRVVSNFGDGDCGEGRNTHARAKFRGDAPLASRLLTISHARVCISPAPQSSSPQLGTTRSLADGVQSITLTPLNHVLPLRS